MEDISSLAGYLLVEDSRRSRRKITASKHYLHLLNAKATKHASQPPFHPCSNHHASGYLYPLIKPLYISTAKSQAPKVQPPNPPSPSEVVMVEIGLPPTSV